MKLGTLLFYTILVAFLILGIYIPSAGTIISPKLPPKILTDLPGAPGKAEKALITTLSEKYPYESPEEKVMQGLKDQGFSIAFDGPSQRSYAMFVSTLENNSEVTCHAYVLIDWDITSDHRIKRFHASVPVLCGDIHSRPPLP